MGNWAGANPDDLDQLAEFLDGTGERASDSVAATIARLLVRASELGVRDELQRLLPLQTWASETAPQLRENASILRGDDDAPLWSQVMPEVNPFIDGAATYDLRVPGQDDANEIIQLAGKDQLTEADLRAMNDLFAEWAANPEFAAFLVDEMGVDEYLRLAQRIEASDANIGENEDLLRSLDEHMGAVLSHAFEVPGGMAEMAPGSDTYQDWITDTAQGRAYQQRLEALQAIGGTQLTGPESPLAPGADAYDPRLGYDVALELLESSQAPVDEQFFDQTMNHLMELEQADPDLWSTDRYPADRMIMDENGDFVPNPDYGWGPENDATDRLLGIAGNSNPDAVEWFFDPERTDNLQYFIGTSDNAPFSDGTTRYVTYGDGAFSFPNHTSPAGYPGLNAALETAATGRTPGSEPSMEDAPRPSEANARIASEAWQAFSSEYETVAAAEEIQDSRLVHGGMFESLRPAMGQIAATYIPSVQSSVAGNDIRPVAQPNPGFGSGACTSMLLYELGKDPENYQAITAANDTYTYLTIDQAVNGEYESDLADSADRVEWAADASGTIAGIMTDARATAVYDEQLAEDSEFNATLDEVRTWTDTSTAVLAGMMPNPAVGLTIGLGGNAISNSIFESLRADSQADAAAQYNREYNHSQGHHREEVVGGAISAATSGEDRNFNDDELADIERAADRGANTGFLNGAAVGRLPEDVGGED